MDFEAAGLLDGLDGEEREARRRLLEQLASDGVDAEELKAAAAEDRLALLPVERVLAGRHTAREVERRTGLPAEQMLRIRRVMGLPAAGEDDPVFSDEEMEAAKSIKLFVDTGFGEEEIVQITRVLGEAMSRLAATTTAAFGETFLEPGDNEEEVAKRFASLAQELTPALTPVLVAAFKSHLRDSVSRGMLGRAEREAGQIANAQEVGVCFADLVGFTRLSGEIQVEEVGAVAGSLADLANDASKPPVRLVKTIGDAAMFVSTEIAPMVDAALTLLEAAEAGDLPALRAGIARGPAVQRAGDYYGNAVNLASRVTGAARPGSVLCTEGVRDAAPDQFDWSFAGKHRLKGVDGPQPLYRARRLKAGGDQKPPADDGQGSSKPGRKNAKKQRADRRRKRGSH